MGQVFLGIWMIIIGMSHLMKKEAFLREDIKRLISEEKFHSYQKGLALNYLLMGMIFISMWIVERQNIFQQSVFLRLYIVLGAMIVIMMLVNNKKHSGYYWLR